VSVRKALFPLLVLFALLSSQISLGYVLFGLLSAGWLVTGRRLAGVRRALAHPLAAAAGVYALLVFLSVVFSRDPRASLRALPSLTLLLLLPITIDLVDTPRRARALLLGLAAGGSGLALLGLAELASGGVDLHNRIRGSLSHYMTFSGLTMIAGCVLIAFLFEAGGRERWLGVAAVIPFAAMLLTLTRGAYVAATVALAGFFALRRPRGLLLLAATLVLLFLLLPAGVRGRAASIPDLSERTNRDRIAMARAGGRMIADRPIFGLGPELVKPYYTLYRDPDAPRWRVPHLHNNVLQIAAASGIFAAGAYLAMLALFFARAGRLLRVERHPGRAVVAAAAFLAGSAAAVAGLFEYNFGDTEVLMATLPILALPFSRGMSDAVGAGGEGSPG